MAFVFGLGVLHLVDVRKRGARLFALLCCSIWLVALLSLTLVQEMVLKREYIFAWCIPEEQVVQGT